MMKTAKHRHGFDRASPLDRSMDRTIFAQRPMGAGVIVVGRVGRQNLAQVRRTKNRDVVEDFALDRANQSFGVRILPG